MHLLHAYRSSLFLPEPGGRPRAIGTFGTVGAILGMETDVGLSDDVEDKRIPLADELLIEVTATMVTADTDVRTFIGFTTPAPGGLIPALFALTGLTTLLPPSSFGRIGTRSEESW